MLIVALVVHDDQLLLLHNEFVCTLHDEFMIICNVSMSFQLIFLMSAHCAHALCMCTDEPHNYGQVVDASGSAVHLQVYMYEHARSRADNVMRT